MPDEQVRLTQLSNAAGCAAKIGPGTLAGILEGLPRFDDPALLVGIETSDDGAIYQINEDTALIQTLDFFPPMTDDPYVFGQVAAANALSDIYAMGGEPKVALNIVAWPNCVNPKFLAEILRGGADKVKEAGAVLAGGHSIQDDVPKYGLSVTGIVHPKRIFKNSGARAGDELILTKPLGTGIINTAVKAELASEEASCQVIQVMTSLNRRAKQILDRYEIHACTDVTGFGLAGHSLEMAKGSRVCLEIYGGSLPLQPEARAYARMGLVPEGAYRNRDYAGAQIETGNAPVWLQDIFFDPQTSGGLLISADKETAEQILKDFKQEGLETDWARIGRAVECPSAEDVPGKKWVILKEGEYRG
ncbi:MAG: selenide, water dikinase SelD [Eubacteriales bacterium]|nr:selenide, water dikinase SelD [Eubacteriales bacterium]